jgi:chemotaxis protein methyltransferase CheR
VRTPLQAQAERTIGADGIPVSSSRTRGLARPSRPGHLPAAPVHAPPSREFEFSAQDFERVRLLIHQLAGIALRPGKQDIVYSRLARRLRALNLKRFADYLDLVEAGDGTEREAFTHALTTNLTAFFREPHHFDLLTAHLLRADRSSPLQVWCTAVSTGEEAYSIAMAAVEAFESFSPPVSVLASDIDTCVLARARDGLYPLERVEKLCEQRARRFSKRGAGIKAGFAQVRPELQRLIKFRRINLLDTPWPVQGPLNAIFCRNVIIYFDEQSRSAIVRRFAPLLRKDGLLFMGHSESLLHLSDQFQPAGRTVYTLAGSRRTGAGS